MDCNIFILNCKYLCMPLHFVILFYNNTVIYPKANRHEKPPQNSNSIHSFQKKQKKQYATNAVHWA